MAQTIINISQPNDGLGDPLRTAMDLQNGMNTELYATKVDKILGKDLSSNDYTTAEKSKLAGIEAGAQVNVPLDWNNIINKPPDLNNSIGYFVYDNTLPAIPVVANTRTILTNNKLGQFTDTLHPPFGVSSLFNSTTNQLDFTQLSIGDTVDVRVDLTLSVADGTAFLVQLKTGIGSAKEQLHTLAKDGSVMFGQKTSFGFSFNIGDSETQGYPAELTIESAAAGNVTVGAFFFRVMRSGVNVIDVVVEADAPNDGQTYGRKNEAWTPIVSDTGKLGLIKIVDKAGDFFTNLATASAYIRTFTSATITDESYSNGTFWFTVPAGSSFGLANYFLTPSGGQTNAYIEDVLGLIILFSNHSFEENNGNNIFGNTTFQGVSFAPSRGYNVFGNCSFYDGAFDGSTGINKFQGTTLCLGTSKTFGENSQGRFEFYGNIGTTYGNDYANFFSNSTAVIWAHKRYQTINAGALEGDLARAQTNGAKLFFGYSDTPKKDGVYWASGAAGAIGGLSIVTTSLFESHIFVDGSLTGNAWGFSTSGSPYYVSITDANFIATARCKGLSYNYSTNLLQFLSDGVVTGSVTPPTQLGALTNIANSLQNGYVRSAYVWKKQLTTAQRLSIVANEGVSDSSTFIGANACFARYESESIAYNGSSSIWYDTSGNKQDAVIIGYMVNPKPWGQNPNYANEFTDEFIYTSGAQNFTTLGNIYAVNLVFRNGQQIIEGVQWTVSGNVVTILDTLSSGEAISVNYKTAPTLLDAPYSKLQVDSKVLMSQTEWKNTNIGTQTIANGATLNLLTVVTEANKVTANTDAFDALSIVSSGIKTVWRNARIAHLVRLTFNIATGNAQYYRLDLKRTTDNSVVASIVVQRNQAYTTQTIELVTRTLSATDPFVTGGFYLSLTNDSGVSATLNGEMQLVIISNYQFPQ